MGELHCGYSDPGVRAENPAGLMGAVGLHPTGHGGALIVDLASTIRDAVATGRADTSNQALRKVLAMQAGGVERIRQADEPFAFTLQEGYWYVREGTHRAIALALLGERVLEALDFESGELE